MMDIVDWFDTQDQRDLVGVYEHLLGDVRDLFEDSGAAVEAFEAAEWLPLLNDNNTGNRFERQRLFPN